jgi:hypothetical protein
MFDIEITACQPEPVTNSLTARNPHEAYMAVLARLGVRCAVRVFHQDRQATHTDFFLWVADDRARVRVDEHREWYATDPKLAPTEGTVEFADRDGSLFSVPMNETVSRQQAMVALADWLDGEEKTSLLTWI